MIFTYIPMVFEIKPIFPLQTKRKNLKNQSVPVYTYMGVIQNNIF